MQYPIAPGLMNCAFEPGLTTFEFAANPVFDPECNPVVNPGCSLQPTTPDESTVKFYHADHLGTTRFMTDAPGATVESSVYSAFGMRISGTNHRYGYDGAWGYQSHSFDEAASAGLDPDTAFPFLHVGHRYYDPSTGRFLQRDPIGGGGGLNVYLYAKSQPTSRLDATGLVDQNWVPPWTEPPRVERPAPTSPVDVVNQVKEEATREGKGDKWAHYMICYRRSKESTFGWVYALPVGILKEMIDNAWPPIDLLDSTTDLVADCWGWWDALHGLPPRVE